MDEDLDENHKNKKLIDAYSESVNLDEDINETVMTMLQKGFCPVERLDDYDLKILPPESFYIYKTKKGDVYRYTQERSLGDVISIWEKPKWKETLHAAKENYQREDFEKLMKFEQGRNRGKLDDIILFFHRKTTSWVYGKSLVEPIGSLLDDRAQMNKDMPAAVHRWAYPIPIMRTRGEKNALQQACVDRDADEWIFIGNAEEGEVTFDTLAIDPQARFIPYIELIYYQICEGLHAPLLLYLKNATEASATVMMESVDRLINGIQRYVKRRVEKFLFEPQVGEPVPRLVWGQPKTGMEEVTLDQVASLAPYLARNQLEDLLLQLGISLPDAEEPPLQQTMQPQPFQKQPQGVEIPVEKMLESVNTMETSLNIIEQNFKEHRINLIRAMKLGERTITVYTKRSHPSVAVKQRNEQFQLWVKRLVGVQQLPGKTYSVSVSN
jgi:hypothetical protein